MDGFFVIICSMIRFFLLWRSAANTRWKKYWSYNTERGSGLNQLLMK